MFFINNELEELWTLKKCLNQKHKLYFYISKPLRKDFHNHSVAILSHISENNPFNQFN